MATKKSRAAPGETAAHLELPPRARILKSAHELFYGQGIRGVGVEAVAAAADTNKMTLQTRYLVVGDLPSERNSLDAHLQGRNRMIKMAEDVGIDQVPVQELLEYMGWRGEERTQALGRGATGTGSNPSGSGEYRSRQPPARGGNGAF